MKLTEYEVSFTGNDSEVVRIDIDRWGKFSATLPRRISKELQIESETTAFSLNDIRVKIDQLRDRYLEHLEPAKRVLIYSITRSNSNDYSSSKHMKTSSINFRWSFAIKKCDDFFLCDENFADVSPYKLDRGRYGNQNFVEFTQENLEKFKKISEGIDGILTMIGNLAAAGFVSDFDKLLTDGGNVILPSETRWGE
jgi:hypothetical protein